MMNIQKATEIQSFLTKFPGHLKTGNRKLAFKFDVSAEDIKSIKKELGFSGDSNKAYEKFRVKKLKYAERNRESIIEGFKNDGIVPIEGTWDDVLSAKEVKYEMPNILILDIETAPIRAYVWRLWKQDIYIDQIISEWFMISWSCKWLNADRTYSDVLTPEEIIKEDDKRLVKSLWNILNDAEIVICHNGDTFDIPRIKSRFAIHGLPPTTFYHQIDTKKVAAKEFGFSSNKLGALAKNFGLGQKIHTEFELWAECMKGNPDALEEMRVYNVHDVELLEKVYLRLRPYIKAHPNVTLYSDGNPNRCPSCGGEHLYKEDFYYTSVGKFQVFRCQDCGALSRDRKAIKRGVVTSNLSLGR